jgi:hypothetical protein
MSLLWLSFSLGFYFLCLIYAFVALRAHQRLFSRVALRAASLGMVSTSSRWSIVPLRPGCLGVAAQRESLLAFFSMTFFAVIYAIPTAPGGPVPHRFFFGFRRRPRSTTCPLAVSRTGDGSWPHHPHLHRIRRARAQLRRQPALSFAERLKAKKSSSLISFLPALK